MRNASPETKILFNRQLLLISRKRLGLTQSELGRELDVTTRTIQHWEYGTGVPSGANLLRLSELLSVPTDELYVIEQAA